MNGASRWLDACNGGVHAAASAAATSACAKARASVRGDLAMAGMWRLLGSAVAAAALGGRPLRHANADRRLTYGPFANLDAAPAAGWPGDSPGMGMRTIGTPAHHMVDNAGCRRDFGAGKRKCSLPFTHAADPFAANAERKMSAEQVPDAQLRAAARIGGAPVSRRESWAAHGGSLARRAMVAGRGGRRKRSADGTRLVDTGRRGRR